MLSSMVDWALTRSGNKLATTTNTKLGMDFNVTIMLSSELRPGEHATALYPRASLRRFQEMSQRFRRKIVRALVLGTETLHLSEASVAAGVTADQTGEAALAEDSRLNPTAHDGQDRVMPDGLVD